MSGSPPLSPATMFPASRISRIASSTAAAPILRVSRFRFVTNSSFRPLPPGLKASARATGSVGFARISASLSAASASTRTRTLPLPKGNLIVTSTLPSTLRTAEVLWTAAGGNTTVAGPVGASSRRGGSPDAPFVARPLRWKRCIVPPPSLFKKCAPVSRHLVGDPAVQVRPPPSQAARFRFACLQSLQNSCDRMLGARASRRYPKQPRAPFGEQRRVLPVSGAGRGRPTRTRTRLPRRSLSAPVHSRATRLWLAHDSWLVFLQFPR
jgi:hypothetical protein